MRWVFWAVVAIAVSVLFLGPGPAAGVTSTIFGVSGTTSGLMVGGIPTFVGTFKNGLSAGNKAGPGAPGGAGSGPASWNGGFTQFGVPTAPNPNTAPAKQRPNRSGKAPV